MNVCKHKCTQFVSWYGKYSSFNSHIDCHLNSLDQDEHSDGHRDKYAMPTETKANTYTKLTRLFANKNIHECMQAQMQTFCIQAENYLSFNSLPRLYYWLYFIKNIDINNIHFSPSHIPFPIPYSYVLVWL